MVLLILAGITISLVFSENGIIAKAKEAADKTKEATENEEKSFREMENFINSAVNGNVQNNNVNLANKTILWFGDMNMSGTGNDNKGISNYFLEEESIKESIYMTYMMKITNNEDNTELRSLQDIIDEVIASGKKIDLVVMEIGIVDCYIYENGVIDKKYQKDIGTIDSIDTSDTVISDFVKSMNLFKNAYPDTEVLYIKSYDTSEEGWKNYAWKDMLKYNTNITLEYLQEYFKASLGGEIYDDIDEYRDLYLKEDGYIDSINKVEERANQLYTEIPKALESLEYDYLDLSTLLDKSYISEDGISLNDIGYRKIEPYITNKIKSILQDKEDTITIPNLSGKKIVWFGDSLISGIGEGSMSDFFESATNSVCYNAAIGGSRLYNKAENNIKNQVENAISYLNQNNIEIDCVVFNGGGNDAYFDTDIGEIDAEGDTIIASFQELVELLKTNFPNIPIIYLQALNTNVTTDYVQEQKERYEEILNKIQTIVGREKINYVDITQYVQKDHIAEDGLHFNSIGYESLIPYIAESIEKVI